MSELIKFHLMPLSMNEALENSISISEQIFSGHILNIQIELLGGKISYLEQLSSAQFRHSEKFKKFRDSVTTIAAIVDCLSFTLSFNSTSIKYINENSSVTARIEIACNKQEQLIDIIHKLDKIFKFVNRAALRAEELPKAQKELFEYQTSILSSLHTEVAKISEFNLIQTKEHSDFLRRATIELEKRNADKQQEIEILLKEKSASLDTEYQSKLADLEKRDAELKARTAEADAKDNMVARRKLLADITKLISDEPEYKISELTSQKRATVRNVVYGSIGLSSTWIIWWVLKLMLWPDRTYQWINYVPIPFGMALLVTSIIYLIKWNDQWAREHALAEMRNKKMKQDILRASWLAEMFFEGKDKERLLPEMLISRFSEGLFTNIETQSTEHPYENMIDLLKKISSVKIGKDTLELNKEASKEKS